jgi:hypothetical protein
MRNDRSKRFLSKAKSQNRNCNRPMRSTQRNRRGAAMIVGVIMMGVLVTMLAFAIDIGYIAVSKAEARRTADAAALAGCWKVYDGAVSNMNAASLENEALSAASSIALSNPVCNTGPVLSLDHQQSADFELGYMDSLSGTDPIVSDSSKPFRAVRVRIQKSEGINGQVPLYFARIFGQTGRDLTVESTAAMATKIKGFSTPSSGASNKIDLLPFAFDQTTWDAMLAGGGSDQYRFDAERNQVVAGSDGVREVNLYPQGTGSPGNRGTVDIGGANNSTSDIARQIVHGISADDLFELGKPLVLDNDGKMTLHGDTGISAGVKDELSSIIGQTRIIPIFESVAGNGNNSMYTIVRWVGVRVLAVKLTGPMNNKHVIVQPAPMIVRNGVPGDASRQWSDAVYSPVVLVK